MFMTRQPFLFVLTSLLFTVPIALQGSHSSLASMAGFKPPTQHRGSAEWKIRIIWEPVTTVVELAAGSTSESS